MLFINIFLFYFQGIIDAGGRNVTLSLQSRTGHMNMLAVVGTLVFTQYWYWFPLAHCLALAFTPTCLIALNAQLKVSVVHHAIVCFTTVFCLSVQMPKLEIKSSAKPSLYAYPAPLEEKKREEREKVTTAVLSIAARQRRRDHDRKHKDDKMEVVSRAYMYTNMNSIQMEILQDEEKDEKKDEKKTAEEKKTAAEDKKAAVTDDKKASASTSAEEKKASDKKEEKDEKKKEPEPTFEVLSNPARILRQQLKVITLNEGSHYLPMKDISIGGIIMVRSLKPSEEELVEPVVGKWKKLGKLNVH